MAAHWGRIAAILIAGLGTVCLVVGIVWTASTPDWADFNVHDPGLTILEALLFALLPLLLLESAAIHLWAPVDRKPATLLSVACMTIFVTLAAALLFVRLTVLRHLDASGVTVPDFVQSLDWPSVPAALGLLAWDCFLGLALICAAPAFKGAGVARLARIGLVASGLLCLAGLLGPVTGEMYLQRIAAFGAALLLPATCVALAVLFDRAVTEAAETDLANGGADPRPEPN